MATSTYEAIGSVSISTGINQVTFTNIPATYTDLELVFGGTNSPDYDIAMIFNGDNAASYSANRIYGDGTGGGTSDKGNNETYFAITIGGAGNPGQSRVSINNYATNNIFKTCVTRSVYPPQYLGISAKLWRRLEPIYSITVIASGASTLQIGSVISLYGIGANTLKASGGDAIMTDGTYWYHAFKSSGTFTPNSALSCDVVVVGGGGGGGKDAGGGGGAGGIFYATAQSISTAQTIVVGGGGLGSTTTASPGSSGTNSSFGSLTAGVGGGGGATQAGANGGSGGGAGRGQGVAGTSTQTGTGGTGYGFAGGSSTGTGNAGAGGGGAGAVGTSITSGTQGKVGGVGLNTWSQWLSTVGLLANGTPQVGYLAGGGGGGGNSDLGANGGYGGGGAGGNGSLVYAIPGSPNTGGGGGGSSGGAGGRVGASGGSGVVLVRYAV